MRFKLILSIDACILAVLLVGLIITVTRIYKERERNNLEPSNEEMIVICKYFLFILFVLTSFVLEYAMIFTNTRMDNDGLFHFFLVNRSIALAFTVVSVIHSIKT